MNMRHDLFILKIENTIRDFGYECGIYWVELNDRTTIRLMEHEVAPFITTTRQAQQTSRQHTIRIGCAENGHTITTNLTDTELALLERIATQLNAQASETGPWLSVGSIHACD